MSKSQLLITAICLLLIVGSCTEKPQASFTWTVLPANSAYKCDTLTYPDCKRVEIINQSLDTEFFEYRTPGGCGGTSSECWTTIPNPILTYLYKGSYIVQLTGYSENRKKKDIHVEIVGIN